MLANREGTFNAYPIDAGVSETGPNHLVTCAIAFHLFEEQGNGEWLDCSHEGSEITGYFYLEKKDGTPNTMAIDALKESLGWDGRDPFWLQDNAQAMTDHPVQLKLGWEEYNGKNKLKVQFLNPYGSTAGGVAKGDANARQSISTRLGPKLRALAGGTPANAPKPAARPAQGASASTAPVPKPAPSAAPVAPAAPQPLQKPANAEATMDQAWATFCEVYDKAGPNGNPEDREQQWFRILAELFPGKQPDQLTPAEWAKVMAEGPTNVIPF